MNRILTGHIAEIQFVPTENNKSNLIKEGISNNIYITGNTVIDAIKHTVNSSYIFKDEILRDIDFSNGRYILLTAHRGENLGKPLENICNAVKRIVEEFNDIYFIYPVHLNPAVRDTVSLILGDTGRVKLINPQMYRICII